MHSTLQKTDTQAIDSTVVESSTFTGEGTELFGCYAAADANAFTGTGTELLGCYSERRDSRMSSGDGVELFGCYKA
ncbi:MAG: hypothetical protein AAF499_14025 [Pseudomonadota bacterium]